MDVVVELVVVVVAVELITEKLEVGIGVVVVAEAVVLQFSLVWPSVLFCSAEDK